MKFYNIPVLLQTKDRTQNLENIIVEHGIHGYREAVTKVPLQEWTKEMTSKQEELIETYGFYFSILESNCVEKNYAKKSDVENYLHDIDKHPFHQFVNEHQYVYGKDAKEVKQMIKQYRKNK